MRYLKLSEAPEALPPLTLYFEDDDRNRKFVQSQMKRVKETLRDNDQLKLFVTGGGSSGWIVMYNKITKMADYVVQYRAKRWTWLPKTVTQCVLWRRVGSVLNHGFTKEVFFDILLPRYGAIMSDGEQTVHGHNFWLDRIGHSVAMGNKVGLAKLNEHSVIWYDGDYTGVVAWVRNQQAFDKGNKFRSLRYIIVDQPAEAEKISQPVGTDNKEASDQSTPTPVSDPQTPQIS